MWMKHRADLLGSLIIDTFYIYFFQNWSRYLKKLLKMVPVLIIERGHYPASSIVVPLVRPRKSVHCARVVRCLTSTKTTNRYFSHFNCPAINTLPDSTSVRGSLFWGVKITLAWLFNARANNGEIAVVNLFNPHSIQCRVGKEWPVLWL